MIKKTFNASVEAAERERLESIENLINNSTTVLAICGINYLVIYSRLFQTETIRHYDLRSKNNIVGNNICLFGSGLQQDLDEITRHSRQIALDFQNQNNQKINIKQLVKEISRYLKQFWYKNGARPFGVKIIVGGFDCSGFSLFSINSRGDFTNVSLIAFGKSGKSLIDFVTKRFQKNSDLNDSITLCTHAFVEIFDSEMEGENFSRCIIDTESLVSFENLINGNNEIRGGY